MDNNNLSAELFKLAIDGAAKGKYWKGYSAGLLIGGVAAGALAIRCKTLSDENKRLERRVEELEELNRYREEETL